MHPGALEIKFYWVSFFQEKNGFDSVFFSICGRGIFCFKGGKKNTHSGKLNMAGHGKFSCFNRITSF